MTRLGGFLKKVVCSGVTVPEVTKIPPEIDSHVHTIMDGISKISLK